MTYKGIVGLAFVVVLGTALIVSAADAPTLVFKDGSTIEVVSLTVVRGSVVVELADGRHQQFDKRYIDLKASGLVPDKAQSSAPASQKRLAPKLVMPGDEINNEGVVITDQDVGHVKQSTDRASGQDEEEVPQSDAPDTIPLRISGVRHSEHDGGVTVTGTVTNDGIFDLEKTTVTGFAIDVDGNILGQGSVGLASLLTQGSSRSFSVMIPATEAVDAVRVSASAAEFVPASPGSEAPDGAQDSGDGSSAPQQSEDKASGDSAG